MVKLQQDRVNGFMYERMVERGGDGVGRSISVDITK